MPPVRVYVHGERHVTQNPRMATEADLVAIEALVASAYEKYIVRIGRKPKPMVADYRNALAHHDLWVLEQNQSLIAVLELILTPSTYSSKTLPCIHVVRVQV